MGHTRRNSYHEEKTLIINKLLCQTFSDVGLILVDYKVEFGRKDGQMILGDEFTPMDAEYGIKKQVRAWIKTDLEKI